jgi:hypothetical protein
MPLEGDLSFFRLPDILQVIAQQQKTGILTVQGENDILAVSFHDGKIVAADALNQSFDEMLGDVLASQGILSPERFQSLVEEHRPAAGERLADFLIRKGALTREQLLAALRFQTYRLLLEVLRWRLGEFKFYSGEEVAFEEGMEPLPVEEVLYRSMRDMLGEGTIAGAMPHGFLAYERVPTDRTLRVAADSVPPEDRDPGVIWISPDEQVLLEQLDGRTPAEQMAKDTGLGDLRIQYALFHLLRAGLVRPAGEEGEPAPVPEPPVPRAARVEQPAGGTPVDLPLGPEPPERPARREAPRAPAPERRRRAAPREDELVAASEHLGSARTAAAVAFLAGAAVVLGIVARPAVVLLPYPSQRNERLGLERVVRQARYAAIDRAARNYYLLEGRYPASLEDLVSRDMLTAGQRYDADGHPLVFEPSEDTYQLAPAGSGGDRSAAITETVAGDVLLDRTMFASVQEEAGVPLILLD